MILCGPAISAFTTVSVPLAANCDRHTTLELVRDAPTLNSVLLDRITIFYTQVFPFGER